MNFTVESLLQAYFYFALYSFGGWIVQGCWVGFKKHHFVNTGFYRGPWVPIFGFGCLLIIYIIDPISRNPFLVFFNSFWMTSVLEYVTSWALQKKYHRLWWNYSDKPFNIHGRVCLLNSVMYGLAGIVITFFVQPEVEKLVSKIPFGILSLIMAVFSVFFLSDVLTTLIEMNTHKKALEQIHQSVQTAEKTAPASNPDLLSSLSDSIRILESHQRHLHGMIHQHLEETYQASLKKARHLLNGED